MQTASNSSQVAVYTRLSHSPSWSPPLSPCSSASDRRRPSELQVWACLQSSKASVLNRAPDCTRRPNSTCCNRVFLKIVFITYMICTECSNISEWKTTSSADSHFQRFLEAVGVPYISCTFSRHQSTTLFFTRNSETRVCFLQSCCPAQEYRWICPCPFDDFRSLNQHTCSTYSIQPLSDSKDNWKSNFGVGAVARLCDSWPSTRTSPRACNAWRTRSIPSAPTSSCVTI